MRSAFSSALIASALLVGCASTETQVGREVTARPRVEQRALSNAIDNAFKTVNFSPVVGQKVFLDTHKTYDLIAHTTHTKPFSYLQYDHTPRVKAFWPRQFKIL